MFIPDHQLAPRAEECVLTFKGTIGATVNRIALTAGSVGRGPAQRLLCKCGRERVDHCAGPNQGTEEPANDPSAVKLTAPEGHCIPR